MKNHVNPCWDNSFFKEAGYVLNKGILKIRVLENFNIHLGNGMFTPKMAKESPENEYFEA